MKNLTRYCLISLSFLSTLSAFGATEMWGGKHIQLVITDKKATITFDCGTGSSPSFVIKKGRVSASGTVTPGTGGPVRPGDPAPRPHGVAYKATIKGSEMKLQISSRWSVENYVLKKGAAAELYRCM